MTEPSKPRTLLPWTKAQGLRWGGIALIAISAVVLSAALFVLLGEGWLRVLFQGAGATAITGAVVLLVFGLERRSTSSDRATERSAEAATRVLDAIRAHARAIRDGADTAEEADTLIHEINRAAATEAQRSERMATWYLDVGREFARRDGEDLDTGDVREILYQGTMSWIEVGFDEKRLSGRLSLLEPTSDPDERVRRIAEEKARKRRK